MKSEREKMLAGEPYIAANPELYEMQMKAQQLLHEFNASSPSSIQQRQTIIHNLFGAIGANFEIRPPFFCDYGSNIFAGERLYINYDCVILDCNVVRLGDNVLLAPKVQIYTAYHPLEADARRTMVEMADPITIGDDVWIGGGAIICPGVQLGNGSTIGAGSVVTRNIPERVFAAGNPCRVIREL
jgi:maltose O-acetyltransferase